MSNTNLLMLVGYIGLLLLLAAYFARRYWQIFKLSRNKDPMRCNQCRAAVTLIKQKTPDVKPYRQLFPSITIRSWLCQNCGHIQEVEHIHWK